MDPYVAVRVLILHIFKKYFILFSNVLRTNTVHMKTIMKIIFTIKNNNENNKILKSFTKNQNHKISNEKEKETHKPFLSPDFRRYTRVI